MKNSDVFEMYLYIGQFIAVGAFDFTDIQNIPEVMHKWIVMGCFIQSKIQIE
jgi:hypothetical protein